VVLPCLLLPASLIVKPIPLDQAGEMGFFFRESEQIEYAANRAGV
jgi:hypothetical protein